MTHIVGTSFRVKFAKRQSRLNPFGDRFWMSCKIILISHSSLIIGFVYQKISRLLFSVGTFCGPRGKDRSKWSIIYGVVSLFGGMHWGCPKNTLPKTEIE